MAKKIWTEAMRKAFRAKMVAAQRAKRGRRRKKNPTKEQVKSAAKQLSKKAASLAWRGLKAAGRTTARAGAAAGKSAAADVKRAICKNPHRSRRRRRARNPRRFLLRAQRGFSRLYYDGANFSARNRAKRFASIAAAAARGRALLKKHRKLRRWKLAVFSA